MTTLTCNPGRDFVNSLGIPVDNLTLKSATDKIIEMARANDGRAMATAVREAFEAGVGTLGAQARLHVEQHYSWDNVVAGLLQHYQAVLGYQPQVRAHA